MSFLDKKWLGTESTLQKKKKGGAEILINSYEKDFSVEESGEK